MACHLFSVQLSSKPMMTFSQLVVKFESEYKKISILENAYENVVCKCLFCLGLNVLRVKSLRPNGAYMRQ